MPRLTSLLLPLLLWLAPPALQASAEPVETDWLQLMPKDEVDALTSGTPSSQAAIDHSMRGSQTGSSRTVAEMDGKPIRIAGYIVPVQTSDDGQLKEFFLVPYFGACIHVPPPPPNQIILARLKDPIAMTGIYDAFWVSGTLKVEATDGETAATAYTMAVDAVKLYE